MKQQIVYLAFALFAILAQQADAFDYCADPNHSACVKNTTVFADTCPSDVTYRTVDKEYILKLHNDLRNLLALGKIPGFQQAEEMPLLSWDEELARLACLNARKCIFEHDKPYGTDGNDKYPLIGQNIAQKWDVRFLNNYKATSIMVMSWFEEFKDANMAQINSYPAYSPAVIGHFTALSNDNSHAIGCCITRYTEGWMKKHHLTCNNGYTNIPGKPVYKAGPVASKCKSKHPTYKGLCA